MAAGCGVAPSAADSGDLLGACSGHAHAAHAACRQRAECDGRRRQVAIAACRTGCARCGGSAVPALAQGIATDQLLDEVVITGKKVSRKAPAMPATSQRRAPRRPTGAVAASTLGEPDSSFFTIPNLVGTDAKTY